MRSSFKRWFKKQFGHRGSCKSLEYHKQEYEKAYYAYLREKSTYENIKAYDERMNDCLHAWNANRKEHLKPDGKMDS